MVNEQQLWQSPQKTITTCSTLRAQNATDQKLALQAGALNEHIKTRSHPEVSI